MLSILTGKYVKTLNPKPLNPNMSTRSLPVSNFCWSSWIRKAVRAQHTKLKKGHNPEGSKDPNIRVLGPKYYNINGIWALIPYYLGPWTLRVTLLETPSPFFALAEICRRPFTFSGVAVCSWDLGSAHAALLWKLTGTTRAKTRSF